VLRHANAGNRVIEPVVDIAVVLDPDLHTITDTLLDRAAPGILGLFVRKGDADRINPVVASSVADKSSPAATDIEDTHPWLESELARHEITLGLLGLVQAERGARLPVVVGTRVRHRGSKHQLVELVADVVVVGDGLRGPAPGMALPQRMAQRVQLRLLSRRPWWGTRDPESNRRLDQCPTRRGVNHNSRAELGIGNPLERRQTCHQVPLDQDVA